MRFALRNISKTNVYRTLSVKAEQVNPKLKSDHLIALMFLLHMIPKVELQHIIKLTTI